MLNPSSNVLYKTVVDGVVCDNDVSNFIISQNIWLDV